MILRVRRATCTSALPVSLSCRRRVSRSVAVELMGLVDCWRHTLRLPGSPPWGESPVKHHLHREQPKAVADAFFLPGQSCCRTCPAVAAKRKTFKPPSSQVLQRPPPAPATVRIPSRHASIQFQRPAPRARPGSLLNHVVTVFQVELAQTGARAGARPTARDGSARLYPAASQHPAPVHL